MKDHPIIFNSEMVRAILDGRKTQTRRVIKRNGYDGGGVWENKDGDLMAIFGLCPYGKPGDRLWVRETWRVDSFMDGMPMWFGFKDGSTAEEQTHYSDCLQYEDWYERICIQSTHDAEAAHNKGPESGVLKDEFSVYAWDAGNSPCRWRPSIHMPRWASRILLKVTDIRVERVQEIDIMGVEREGTPNYNKRPSGADDTDFRSLWDSINAKHGFGWDKNPWVWVVEFKRV